MEKDDTLAALWLNEGDCKRATGRVVTETHEMGGGEMGHRVIEVFVQWLSTEGQAGTLARAG